MIWHSGWHEASRCAVISFIAETLIIMGKAYKAGLSSPKLGPFGLARSIPDSLAGELTSAMLSEEQFKPWTLGLG
jgi:hypothetical protein